MANDVLDTKYMMAVVNQVQLPRAYIAQDYLPSVDVSEDELTWDVVKDEQQLAGIHAVDGVIKPGDEAIFSQMFSDVMRIGASRVIPESAIRKLRDPGMVGIQTGYIADIRAAAERVVAKRLLACNSEVDATMEYVGMKALQGYIPWPPPEWGNPPGPLFSMTKFAIDYGFKHRLDADAGIAFGSQTLGAGYYWTDLTNSDPVRDCMAVETLLAERAGIDTGEYDIILSKQWKYWLIQNATLRDILKQSSSATGLLNWQGVQSYWEATTGWRLRFYDAVYTRRTISTTDQSDITIEQKRILPTNVVLFVPRQRGLIGDFPTSPSKANGWRTGKFTWREEKQNPWNVEVGVGINAFPRITIPDAVAVLTVADAPLNPPNITP